MSPNECEERALRRRLKAVELGVLELCRPGWLALQKRLKAVEQGILDLVEQEVQDRPTWAVWLEHGGEHVKLVEGAGRTAVEAHATAVRLAKRGKLHLNGRRVKSSADFDLIPDGYRPGRRMTGKVLEKYMQKRWEAAQRRGE